MFGFLQRLRHGQRRVFAAPEWPAFAGDDWADTVLDVRVTDRYFVKQGRSISRWTLEHDRRTLVAFLKRHYRLPRWHGFVAALTGASGCSPGWGEHCNLQVAESLGIPVPRTLAAAEYLRPGGRLQSVLAVEELTGMLPLHEAIPLASRRLSAADFARWKRGLTNELVRLTRLLHDERWFHKDLYLCHFYVAEADIDDPPACWTRRIAAIDFHRLRRHSLTHLWWKAKDLGQLLYSSEIEGITARDRLRFWKGYVAGPRSTWSWLVGQIVRLRAHNNRGHNQRRPQSPGKVVQTNLRRVG